MAFESAADPEQVSLRAVVEYWWAPFRDAKRDVDGQPLAGHPWVRLNFGYACERQEGGHVWRATTQTNIARPAEAECRHCHDVAATSLEAPTIRLIG